MDIYTTTFLSGVVHNLKRPQTFLMDTFFPGVIQHTAEEIAFDVEDGKRRIAPFVHPTHQGKIVEGLGFQTKTFSPAYIKPKTPIDPSRPLKRRIGEMIGGADTPNAAADREQMIVVQELTDHARMIMRRKEVMAAEILRTGKVTVKGDGYPTVVVDFGRKAGHTVDLSGGAAEWSDAGINPLEDVEDWSLTVLQNSGAMVTDVVMDPLAWRLFKAGPDFDKIIDKRRGDLGAVMDRVQAGRHIQYMGTDGARRYWVYQEWYVDPDTETETQLMPDNTVILAAAGEEGVDGIRHYGAIRDPRAGYQAMEMFPKSWIVEDPALRMLMTQSAPLLVPYRPDATFCATVD